MSMTLGRRLAVASPLAGAIAVVALVTGASAGDQNSPCFGKDATISSGNGSNTVTGTPEADVIYAGGGDDYVIGLEGNDRICAGPGNDVVDAGSGKDKANGAAGRDHVFGNTEDDKLLGGDGDDRGNVAYEIYDPGKAGLFGGDDDDEMSGDGGADACDGGPGGGDSASKCESIKNVP